MLINKILIADDEPLIRNLIHTVLKRRNIEITSADNGLKAITLIKKQDFDLRRKW